MAEWLITERGFGDDYGTYSGYLILGAQYSPVSLVSSGSYDNKMNYRPVFYINNTLKIVNGNGTKNSPFIIN